MAKHGMTAREALFVMALLAVTQLVTAPPATAQVANGVTEVEVRCNDAAERCRQVYAKIEFPGGISGELVLSFEEATALNRSSFDITAELVDPLDPKLRSRFPRNVFVPNAFPVIVRINPRRGSELTFRRNWTLELVASNVEFKTKTPLRLFRAPDGGAFEEISVGIGSGSTRLRGFGGGFSEFAIAADLRPVGAIAEAKFLRLRAVLEANAEVLSPVLNDLLQPLDMAAAAAAQGNLRGAIGGVETFVGLVRQLAGDEIPDESNVAQDHVSVAAQLLTGANTLRHTLILALQAEQEGIDGFRKVVEVEGDCSGSVAVSLDFEEGFQVDLETLEIEAECVDPNDPALLARLPDGVQVPEEFPVVVEITPSAASEQAFTGLISVDLRTRELTFDGGAALRLFRAPNEDSPFTDVTQTFSLGSTRLRGFGGGFSEFLIARDLRPIEQVIGDKLERAAQLLENPVGLPAATAVELRTALAVVRRRVEEGRPRQAVEAIAAFVALVRSKSGSEIPAAWRSTGEEENVAGDLRSLAETLAFSLELLQTPAPDPADVNRDGVVDLADLFQLINRLFGSDKTSPGKEP